MRGQCCGWCRPRPRPSCWCCPWWRPACMHQGRALMQLECTSLAHPRCLVLVRSRHSLTPSSEGAAPFIALATLEERVARLEERAARRLSRQAQFCGICSNVDSRQHINGREGEHRGPAVPGPRCVQARLHAGGGLRARRHASSPPAQKFGTRPGRTPQRTRSAVFSCSASGPRPAGDDAAPSPSPRPPRRAPTPRRSPFKTPSARVQLAHAAVALRRLRSSLRALSRRQAATEAALRRLTHLVNVSIAHF